MSQLVLLTGFLGSKPESLTADGRATATSFQLRIPVGNRSYLWHATTFLDSVSQVLHGLEIGEPLSVAGRFHIDVFREPKVKLRYQVEVRQLIALRPTALAPGGSER